MYIVSETRGGDRPHREELRQKVWNPGPVALQQSDLKDVTQPLWVLDSTLTKCR